jgi:hypothetical protein
MSSRKRVAETMWMVPFAVHRERHARRGFCDGDSQAQMGSRRSRCQGPIQQPGADIIGANGRDGRRNFDDHPSLL